jgi:hypothetical protein
VPETKPLPPDASEALFQAAVIKIADACKYGHWHNTNARKSAAGWFDLVLWRGPAKGYPPRVIYIELKKIGGRMSPPQKQIAAEFADAGQEVYCFWPKDLDEIERILAGAAPWREEREMMEKRFKGPDGIWWEKNPIGKDGPEYLIIYSGGKKEVYKPAADQSETTAAEQPIGLRAGTVDKDHTLHVDGCCCEWCRNRSNAQFEYDMQRRKAAPPAAKSTLCPGEDQRECGAVERDKLIQQELDADPQVRKNASQKEVDWLRLMIMSHDALLANCFESRQIMLMRIANLST